MRLLFAPTKLVVRWAKRHQSGSNSQSRNIVGYYGKVTGGKVLQNIFKSEKKGKRKQRRMESYAADSQQTFNHHVEGNSDHGAFVIVGRTG